MLRILCTISLLASLTTGARVAAAGAGPEAPVVGGTPAPRGRWPDAAAIRLREGLCSGTLIAPDVVLTAGHCIDGGPLEVVLDTVDFARPGGERIRVAWSRAYPSWRSRYDVGVLVLERPAERVRPRRVAAACTARAKIAAGREVTIAGFGITAYGDAESNSRLHQATLLIADPACADNPACAPAIAPNGEFIAGGRGSDACFGDSGGPAYIDAPGGPALAGVISRGYSLPGAPCGGGGIYVRADRVAPWIERVTERRLARTSCEGRGDGEDLEPDDAGGDGDTGGCAAGGGGGGAPALAALALLCAVTAARAGSRTRRREARCG
jgi:secreted trypsin-like serine protease